MADNLSILTANAASDGWIDSTPGAISTGYVAQNTNIQSRTVGMDNSYAYVSGTDVIVSISGPIDDNGVPFSITSAVTLTPASDGTYYIRVVAGSAWNYRDLELISSAPTWDAAKNALVDGTGYRVLNWVIYKAVASVKVFRLTGQGGDAGSATETGFPYGFVRKNDVKYAAWMSNISNDFAAPDTSLYGLTFDSSNNNLISCDHDGTIYVHNGVTSSTLSSFSAPGTNTTSLAYDSSTGNLISCDDVTDLIYIHDGVSSSVLSSFAAPGSAPSGLTIDTSTGNLISCLSLGDVFIHDGVTSSTLSSFSAPITEPVDLTFDSEKENLICISNYGSTRISIMIGATSSEGFRFSITGNPRYGLAYSSVSGNLISCTINHIYVHGF